MPQDERQSSADRAPTGTRRPEFARCTALEDVLADLARWVGPGADAEARGLAPRTPTLLICGTPRSGSTMLMHLLARTGAVRVPTNLHARFWRAPAVGEAVWRQLRDPAVDFRGELHISDAVADPHPLRSDLGKTTGIDGPSEFWYFWRHHLRFGDPPVLGPDGRAQADVEGFRGHLGLWERAAGRPLAMKALLASWELPFLAEVLPLGLFIDLRRDAADTEASLLRARRHFFGDEAAWYSFRLPDEVDVARLSPAEQVARQVATIRAAVQHGLARIAPRRVFSMQLEQLVRSPGPEWARLQAWLGDHGVHLPALEPHTVHAIQQR